MKTLAIRTCAKINLCLRVLGRRTDGYHNVETVLHTVGLWDSLRLAPLPEPRRIVLHVDAGEVPADDSNLCWKAADLLGERARPAAGVSITLDKTIPVAAGLGGGSSDAAATLVGLSRLWGLDLPQGDLDALAAQIGADVPFFLRGGCCLARGKGEKLDVLPPSAAWTVIVVPDRRVVTTQAYAALGRGAARGRRRTLTRPTQRTVAALQTGSLDALRDALHNDFEALQMVGIEDARRAKEALIEAGCLAAGISGSGPAAFGITTDQEAAERAADRLRPSWNRVHTAPALPPGRTLIITESDEARLP